MHISIYMSAKTSVSSFYSEKSWRGLLKGTKSLNYFTKLFMGKAKV